ncbi:chitinase-like protein Idgf4 [Uranotaenia lowii]|uniref:chitinase-like protein Idgf4 n=1 Tax=Uranotaenia lowii TaxID=190385 RepID=UPI002479DCE1|nr:chitinase-like protein Idgf4 [Uranotaenia lowii]
MWFSVTTLLLLAVLATAQNKLINEPKVFCYYNGKDTIREEWLLEALPFCTHLIYGYAAIDPYNSCLVPVDDMFDCDHGRGHYRGIISLKEQFPGLKILLSIGFHKDWNEPLEKYLTVLETHYTRSQFVNSAYALLRKYGFDGLDLAWQFPQSAPKPSQEEVQVWWLKYKKIFTRESIPDPKADEHKEEFTALVRDLEYTFRAKNLELGLTVLPHVNTTAYLDVPLLIDNLNYVHLAAFDQQTPLRNPKEGDYAAPIYEPEGRVAGNSIEAKVNYWLANQTPSNKIILGIPTYGRAWRLSENSNTTGIPPIKTDGAYMPQFFSDSNGRFRWPDICAMLPSAANPNATFTKVDQDSATTGRFGVYGFQKPNHQGNGKPGIWMSYEDPESTSNKAAYAKAKGLGGVAIFDLYNDDFAGRCNGLLFPILKAASQRS